MTKSHVQQLFFVATVSIAVLAYEVQLTRILAARYWDYFAAMIISLAMLGFAASGTALSLLSRFRRRSEKMLPGMTLCLVLAMMLCPGISQRIEVRPLTVLWDPLQLWMFAANYLVLSMPFFFGGFIVGHYFFHAPISAGRIYFANMLGSGLGIAAALLLLSRISPPAALSLAVLPMMAVAWLRFPSKRQRAAIAALVLILPLPALISPSLPAFSEYKQLSGLMLVPDAEIEHQEWNIFGHLAVADSETLRYAPGLSLGFVGQLPEQKAIFINGDSRQIVLQYEDEELIDEFFQSLISALAYRFHDRPSVLVAGAGGGMDILGAISRGAGDITALETNPEVIDLMRGPLSSFSGDIYRHPAVRVRGAGARTYANLSRRDYDLVWIPARHSPFASAAGTSAQDTDYTLTVESFSDYLSLLAPGGVLALETWLNLPPRHGSRIFATAAEALRSEGLEPRHHLLKVRSLRTVLVLVFRDAITPRQVRATRDFCDHHSFDMVYHPWITTDEVNRFNFVEGAPYYNLAQQVLDKPDVTFQRHIFRINPPRDDRPYFAHFFKWPALPRLIAGTGPNVAVHIGWGYMFLLITLAQAIPLGIIIILLPLALVNRKKREQYAYRGRVYSYFAFLGFGFMFVEMAAIQQFSRFMPHPIYAFGAAIGLVLLASGMGAYFSRAVEQRTIFGIIVVLIAAHAGLWRLAVLGRSFTIFALDVLLVGILAFFLGMPLPRAMERLRSSASGLVPWAWGINGLASVLAVLTAGLLSLSLGLTAVVLLAGFCYAAAAVLFPPRMSPPC